MIDRVIAPLTAFGMFVAGWMFVVGAPSSGQEPEPPEGETLFMEHKCNACHGVPAAGIEAKTKSEKLRGSDLGGSLDGELAELGAFLRKEAEREGVAHKKKYTGSDEELQAIVDWLASLEAAESPAP